VSDPLADLLRKCHRDELLPLAALVGVRSEGMHQGSLANAIGLRLRWVGSHAIVSFARYRGQPPPWERVLADVGVRLGLEVPADPALAELAIVRHQLKRTWSGLTADEKADRWRKVVGDQPVPMEGEEAIAQLERRSPPGVGLFVTRLVTEPFVPLPGCLMLLWLGRARDDLALPAILMVSKLRQSVRHRVTVGIVGSPSSGKDAAVGAIFGMPTGNVNPVAGSTKQVEIRKLPGSSALYVVNTPGMGDVVEQVTEEARQVLDHIDVFVYLVNAQGGVQARERADYAACRARGRPVLAVVNKIDTLRDADRERFVRDCRDKLGAAEEDVAVAAFDPLPQLVPAPIGVAEVRAWIQRHLETLGKDPRELPWVREAAELRSPGGPLPS
jgi:GTP-binding protein EngB required for normal cell division